MSTAESVPVGLGQQHGQVPEFSVRHLPRQPGREGRHYKDTQTTYRDTATFQHDLLVLRRLQRARSLAGHAPRLVHVDEAARAITVRYPRLIWKPLHVYAGADGGGLPLDSAALARLKRKLRAYVRELLDRGVAYPLKPDYVFLTRKVGTGPALFLGDWADCVVPEQVVTGGLGEWRRIEADILARVEQLFAPLEEQAAGRQLCVSAQGLSLEDRRE